MIYNNDKHPHLEEPPSKRLPIVLVIIIAIVLVVFVVVVVDRAEGPATRRDRRYNRPEFVHRRDPSRWRHNRSAVAVGTAACASRSELIGRLGAKNKKDEPFDFDLDFDPLHINPLDLDPLDINPLDLDPLYINPLDLDLDVDPLETSNETSKTERRHRRIVLRLNRQRRRVVPFELKCSGPAPVSPVVTPPLAVELDDEPVNLLLAERSKGFRGIGMTVMSPEAVPVDVYVEADKGVLEPVPRVDPSWPDFREDGLLDSSAGIRGHESSRQAALSFTSTITSEEAISSRLWKREGKKRRCTNL